MLRRDALHVISGSGPSVGRCRCTKPERLPTLVGGVFHFAGAQGFLSPG